jgi:hypothetical protein
MGLEGKTPAEKAGIDVKGWKQLLETSIKGDKTSQILPYKYQNSKCIVF